MARNDLRQKSNEDLKKELKKLKEDMEKKAKEIFEGKEKNFRILKGFRKDIARIKTILAIRLSQGSDEVKKPKEGQNA